MTSAGMTWGAALAEAGCYDFLGPVAAGAVDATLEGCPGAVPLVGDEARASLYDLCLSRLGMVYERPLLQRALARVGMADKLELASESGSRSRVMLRAAKGVRDEVMADGGASLRARLPLSQGYEQAVVRNFVEAATEFLERLLLRRDDISRELLGGRPITRLLAFSTHGADSHRHGRMVMRVDTEAGSFYYKPHGCELDALFSELVGAWFPTCVRTAALVLGEGHAFVERLVPEDLSGREGLRRYWYGFGCLAALFHALGSRDMTSDNVMCCGARPAVVDLETLLTGEMAFDREALGKGIPEDSLVSTAVLPVRMGGMLFSPLVADNAAGTCLPRVGGEPRTVKGYERAFSEGFEEGYRRLMRQREDVSAMLGRYGDASCRQLLLNTWAYWRSRTLLFSPSAMADPMRRDKVLAELNAGYAVFPAELRERVAPFDAAALQEGDIPYYRSYASSRTLYAGDGEVVGELLSKSALEVASARLAQLSEDELQLELGLIREHLGAWEDSGGRP